jgi:hypothetical protein
MVSVRARFSRGDDTALAEGQAQLNESPDFVEMTSRLQKNSPQLVWEPTDRMLVMIPERPAGCSKRPSSKAAGGTRTGGVPSGAHGATNKGHQVCARRRVSEAAGSPLRILAS